MDIFEKLEKLRRSHNYCEDSWYSCPKAEDGCANDSAGDDCDCGADNENKLLDEIINELRNSLKSVERNDSGGVEAKPSSQQLKESIAFMLRYATRCLDNNDMVMFVEYLKRIEQRASL